MRALALTLVVACLAGCGPWGEVHEVGAVGVYTQCTRGHPAIFGPDGEEQCMVVRVLLDGVLIAEEDDKSCGYGLCDWDAKPPTSEYEGQAIRLLCLPADAEYYVIELCVPGYVPITEEVRVRQVERPRSYTCVSGEDERFLTTFIARPSPDLSFTPDPDEDCERIYPVADHLLESLDCPCE